MEPYNLSLAGALNENLLIHQLVSTSLTQLCHSSLSFKQYVHITGELKFNVDAESHNININESIQPTQVPWQNANNVETNVGSPDPDVKPAVEEALNQMQNQPETAPAPSEEVKEEVDSKEDDFASALSLRSTRSGTSIISTAPKKPFGCLICTRSFLTKAYAEKHIATHRKDTFIEDNIVFNHGKLPFKCETCGEGFDEISKYKIHVKTHPKKDRVTKDAVKYEEDDESLDIPNEIHENEIKNMKNDLASEEGYPVPKKEKKVKDPKMSALSFIRPKKKGKKKRQQWSAEPAMKPFGCEVCNKTFFTKPYLKKHLMKHKIAVEDVEKHIVYHKGEQPFKCKYCGERFDDMHKRKLHVRTHTGQAPICNICTKVFSTNAVLQQHLFTHDPNAEKAFACKVCQKAFLTGSKLNSHMETHGDKHHICDTCGKGFACNKYLQIHIRTHTGERPYVCHVCGKSFFASSNLATHKRIHTGQKPYKCTLCVQRFLYKDGLQRHMALHTGEKAFNCETCGKAFSTRNIYNTHMKSHGDKSFCCDLCGKGFVRKRYLEIHRRTHSGEKPHTCTICGKSYSASSSLSIHKRTHTGEKPYHCSLCGAQFAYKEALRRHTFTHTGEKQYVCKLCGKECTSQKDYRLHKKAHREAEHAVKNIGQQAHHVQHSIQNTPISIQNTVQNIQHAHQVQNDQRTSIIYQQPMIQQNIHTDNSIIAQSFVHAQQLEQIANQNPQDIQVQVQPNGQITYMGLEHIYLC